MASGGEVGGSLSANIGSEDLEDVKCQPCQDDGDIREAVGVCTDCQEYLCRRCFDSHKVPRPTRDHTLLNKEELMQSQIQLTKKDKCTIRCPKHGDKNVKYYCSIHGQLSCSVCLNLDHRVCNDVTYIPDVADDLDNNKEYRKAEDHLSSVKTRSRKAGDIAKQNSEALDSSYSEALQMIKVFRKDINDAIDRIEREITEKASEMKSIEMKEMVRTSGECIRIDAELNAAVKKVETFRKQKQNCNLFTEMMKIKTMLDNLGDELKVIEREHSFAKTEFKFTPNKDTLELLQQTDVFGNLTVTRKEGLNPKATCSASDTSTHTIIKADHSHDINVKCSDDQLDCWIPGSVILPDNRLLIADWSNDKIKAVDVKHGNVTSQLTLSSKPWDIAVINDNQVAVTCTLPWVRKLDFITTAETLAVERSLQLEGDCRGIDYRDGKLAVSFLSPHQIKIIDLQGTVLHTIQPVKQGIGLFKYPYYTSFGPDSTTLYVSNDKSKQVVCTNLDGTVLGCYTDDDLTGPRGIVIDRYGKVYVCDIKSHTIHQLTPDCKKIRLLLTEKDGLRLPYSVSYSESEKRIYIGMKNCNSVKVYKATLGRD